MGLKTAQHLQIAPSHAPEVDASVRRRDAFAGRAEALDRDLAREVHGLLGIVVDVIDMNAVLAKIDSAARTRTPLLISTPNLDFLVTSRRDPAFRESILASDLCAADGMPVVWLGRLMGIPLRHRVAGSDMFAALKMFHHAHRRLSVFLFGGGDGVAARAAARLDTQTCALACAGYLNPGFCPVEDMSSEAIIDTINASNADFLSVSLSAKKGQAWLLKNNHRLRPPVRVHLGAVINFEAGTVKRAPKIWQRYGLEWIWRIKEEPHLWPRYVIGLGTIIELLLTRVVPLALATTWYRLTTGEASADLRIKRTDTDRAITLSLHGEATAAHAAKAAQHLQQALDAGKAITIDLSAVSFIDSRFFGLMVMARKQLRDCGLALGFVRVPPRVRRLFRLHEFDYLLTADEGRACPRHG